MERFVVPVGATVMSVASASGQRNTYDDHQKVKTVEYCRQHGVGTATKYFNQNLKRDKQHPIEGDTISKWMDNFLHDCIVPYVNDCRMQLDNNSLVANLGVDKHGAHFSDERITPNLQGNKINCFDIPVGMTQVWQPCYLGPIANFKD